MSVRAPKIGSQIVSSVVIGVNSGVSQRTQLALQLMIMVNMTFGLFFRLSAFSAQREETNEKNLSVS